MGSKTRLGSYCTKRANNGVNLVTSRNINTRLARPIARKFVQTTGKLVRTSGTRSVCFTGSDVLGCKKQTTTKVNKNNRDLASTPLEK